MLGVLRREASGNIVTFVLEGTEDLLWRAPMRFVPRANELVGHVDEVEDTVAQWYKVEEVRYELYHETLYPGGGEAGPEVEVEAEYAEAAPVVVVSVVP